jgi:hypothetical protein
MTWFRRAEEQRAEVLSLLDREGSIKASSSRCSTCAPRGSPGSRRCRASAARRRATAAQRVVLPGAPRRASARAGGRRAEHGPLGARPADRRVPVAERQPVDADLRRGPRRAARRPVERGHRDHRERARHRRAEPARDARRAARPRRAHRGRRRGAGYAGFTQLLRLRPDIIKLDRALCHGVSSDDYRAALIGSFVRFARSIDSLICAEGIETMSDLRTLAELDVTYGQGYALAAPGRPWPEVDPGATETCYAAWQAALHGRGTSTSLDEARLERVATRLSSIRRPEDIPGALDEVCRDLGAERAALRRVLADGTLATVGGAPLTSAVRIDERSPEFAHAAGRLLVLPIETGGTTHGLLEVMAPEGRPWHRSEIHRARVLAQLFAHALTGASAVRLAAALEAA